MEVVPMHEDGYWMSCGCFSGTILDDEKVKKSVVGKFVFEAFHDKICPVE